RPEAFDRLRLAGVREPARPARAPRRGTGPDRRNSRADPGVPRLAQGRVIGAVLMIKETGMMRMIKTALAASLTTLALAPCAHAADTYVYGRYFNDGLDSRQGAYEFGKATERAGYGLYGSLTGAT